MFLFRKVVLICVATSFALGTPSLHGQTLSGGVLTITTVGTASNDDILISEPGNNVVVRLNGVETAFPSLNVDSLEVLTGDGSDTIRNTTSIPMEAHGGDDDDTITGGLGDDELDGGNGLNIIYGREGDDLIRKGIALYGGPGDDSISLGSLMRGGAGNDVIVGDFSGSSIIYGGPGNDRILGGTGDDAIFGNAGNDSIYGRGGDDQVSGGPDVDFFEGVSEGPVIVGFGDGTIEVAGGAGADVIRVTEQAGMLLISVETPNETLQGSFAAASVPTNSPLRVFGNEGNDTLITESSVITRLAGGDGDDVLINAGSGTTRFRGEAGDDTCMTNTDFDSCLDDDGNDTYILNGGSVAHRIQFAADAITVIGSGRDERVSLSSVGSLGNLQRPFNQIMMGPGNDKVFLNGNLVAPVVVRCGDGDDTVCGGIAEERIFGDGGDDFLFGRTGVGFGVGGGPANGDQVMYGGSGDDFLTSGSQQLANTVNESTALFGGPGDDELLGGYGNDLLYGGTGNDLLIGRLGDDLLRGQGGNDDLRGGDGNDLMFGDSGNDQLLGGNGDDRLVGGAGVDTVLGGPGNDTEIY